MSRILSETYQPYLLQNLYPDIFSFNVFIDDHVVTKTACTEEVASYKCNKEFDWCLENCICLI